jgi:hypothetical protein
MFHKLTIKDTFLFCFILTIVATIYAYYNNDKEIKFLEKKLTSCEILQLYWIRFVHYFIAFFMRIYPLLTNVIFLYDVLYLYFGFLILCNWFIFSECILSLYEKQILDKKYFIASNVEYQPFYRLLLNSPLFYKILKISSYMVVSVVLIRIFFYKYETKYKSL